MIQINDTSERVLNKICNEHLAGVKPVVLRAISKHIPKKQHVFFNTNIDRIITGLPQELINVHTAYKRFCTVNHTTANTHITEAFSYDNFLKRKTYNIYDLAKKLRVHVCPYCNRQYTFTVSSTSKNITRPEFDHFFSQEAFPMLALSFYNLIPSCYICNSRLKGRKKFTLKNNIHPYIGGFDNNLNFTYFPETTDAAIGLTDDLHISTKLRPGCSDKTKIQSNCDLFQLEAIYKEHKDSVREIVRKHYVSGGKYLKILAKTLPDMETSQEELYQLAFGNFYDPVDFNRRPLGKLTKDIFEQLKFDII